MHPARNSASQSAPPTKKAWIKPEFQRIDLTEEELALVKYSDDSRAALGKIYREHKRESNSGRE